jgi:hypothetical protein
MALSEDRFVPRHVLPVGAPAPTDPEGFLLLGRSWLSSSAAPHPIPIEDLVEGARSFVLLASDGAGKSRSLHHMHTLFEPAAEWVSLVGSSIDRMRDSLERAVASRRPIYVDAIDVALHHEPALADVLAGLLQDDASGGVLWRLACRPASWNLQLARAFAAHAELQAKQTEYWRTPSEFTLLPLTREGAARVAEGAGANSASFLDALVGSRMGQFASHPGRLSIIAAAWAADGRLPSGHVAVLEKQVEMLLSEAGVGRPSRRLSASRRFKIAERLGAFAMFGGITRFSTDDRLDEQVAALSALPHEPEPTEVGIEYLPEQYREVADSALFEAALDGTLSFPHQQYPEFLAARYLTQRNAAPSQIRSLLGVTETGALPSGMTGVAAWIAALKPELIRDTVLDNATALLSSRVDLPSEELRADIIDRVLNDAANCDIDLLWGERFVNLAHGELAEQLLSRLRAGLASGYELWWISRLARDGNCRVACDAILTASLSDAWPDWARGAGVHTIGVIGTDSQLQALQALLHLPEGEDPNDDILAGVIDAIYPRHLTTTDLLQALRPRRNRHFSGFYTSVLRDLPDVIPASDLTNVIDWACALPVVDLEGKFGVFIPQLVAAAWAAPPTACLMSGLARLVATIAEHPPWGSGLAGRQPPWSRADQVDRRRELLLAVLDELGDGSSYLVEGTGLLTEVDQFWVLEVLPTVTGPARAFLAGWVASSGSQSVPFIDAVLSLPPEHPAYDLTAWWRGAWAIDCPAAQPYRDSLARRTERNRQAEENTHTHKKNLRAAIAEAATDVDQWWRILIPLSNPGIWGGCLFNDLTQQTGWSWLTSDEQDQVLELGWQYLQTHRLNPKQWVRLDSVSEYDAVLPDWAGVYFLTSIAGGDPQQLAKISDDVWIRWAPAIIGAWDIPNYEEPELRVRLLERFPTPLLPSLAAAFFDYLDLRQAAGTGLIHDAPIDWSIAATASELSAHLLDGRFTGKLAVELLERLSSKDPAQAVAASLSALGGTGTELEMPALRILAVHAPRKLLEILGTRPWPDGKVVDCMSKLDARRLQVEVLEAVTLQLVQRFPLSETATWETGWISDDDAASEILKVRDRALQRLGDLGRVDCIRQISAGLAEPAGSGFKALIRRARTNAAGREIHLVGPQELVRLLERADARLIRDESDLMTAILEQFRVIQHELQDTGLFRDIWNDCSPTPTPKVEDSITDWLERQLDLRFQQPIFIEREPQVVRRKERGTGTRIDLKLSAPTLTRTPERARVILEAKRLDNGSLSEAMDRQLRQQYLLPENVHHGIYIVYWIRASQRPLGWRTTWSDRQALLHELQQQAESLQDVSITPVVLDISRPESSTPTR